jgi:hypothetical protein
MYYEAYVFNYVVLDISIISPMPHQAHNPNNYGTALMSAPPQVIAPNLHTNLLNVYIQIVNKMALQQQQQRQRQRQQQQQQQQRQQKQKPSAGEVHYCCRTTFFC